MPFFEKLTFIIRSELHDILCFRLIGIFGLILGGSPRLYMHEGDFTPVCRWIIINFTLDFSMMDLKPFYSHFFNWLAYGSKHSNCLYVLPVTNCA